MSTKKIPFKKPPLTPDKHVELLVSRGLIVPEGAKAEHYLRFIGYYRLSGYCLPFQVDNNKDGSHQFLEGITFEHILQLYIFDRKLRLLVMDAIERIEISFRACISDYMCTKHNDPHWYVKKEHFWNGFDHEKFMSDVDDKIKYDKSSKRNPAAFIIHFYEKYTSPKHPPSWMIFELISLGAVSRVYAGLNTSDQKSIARVFDTNYKVLKSWMHSLTYVRNLCAHHQRLWNRHFTIQPNTTNEYKKYLASNTNLYAQLCVIQILLKKIALDPKWSTKLSELLNGYSQWAPQEKMGFPQNWRKTQLWQR